MVRRQHLSAIIYDKRGRIISKGKNSYEKTHPIQAKFATKAGLPLKQTIHAEIDSIIRCDNPEKAHKIYIEREMRDGSKGLAKPCPICELAIKVMLPNLKIIEHT